MAHTVRGQVPLKFGTTTITGYIVMKDVTKEDSAENLQIFDGTGEIVTDISGISPQGTISCTFIPKTAGTAAPVPGATITVGVDASAAVVFVVDKCSIKNESKQVSVWSITGHYNAATIAG